MSFEVLFFAVLAGGWLAGRLFERLKLPAVLGMTLFGILLAILAPLFAGENGQVWPGGFWELVPFLKSLALVVILLRAGLGISRRELQRAGLPALLMTFVPCLLEGFALTALLMWLLDFSFFTAGLTAFMLAAVSPAVVVPSMLDLRSRGLGQRNGIITVILAGASVDDVFAITMFTVFLGLAEGAAVPVLAGEAGLGVSAAAAAGPGTLGTLLGLPLALFGGLAIGLLLGLVLAWWFKKHHESIRATEKMLLLLASALFLVQIGNWFHLAALLGVMAVGFVLLEKAETVAHELAAKLGKIWIFAQILLFVIIGLSLELPALQAVGGKALLALALGLAARSFGVLLATWPSAMSLKERWFCVIAYLPKATVQAALGGVALAAGLPEGRLILAIAVLAIVVTAPLGLIGIRLGARYLLD